MQPSLIMLRGLPGAGKSTLARVLAADQWPLFSIDDHFTDPATGEYRFDHLENHVAYSRCVQRTAEAMRHRAEKIFVDNTFTLEWEMEPYFQLAAEHGYRIFVATVENRHGTRNVHGVTGEQLAKMAAKYRVVLC